MSTQLQQAKQALEIGAREEAQMLAADALKQDPNNPEAWYLLSEAVEGERKLIFLRKAVDLNPEYVEAQNRLSALESDSSPEPVSQPITPTESHSDPAPAFQVDMEEDMSASTVSVEEWEISDEESFTASQIVEQTPTYVLDESETESKIEGESAPEPPLPTDEGTTQPAAESTSNRSLDLNFILLILVAILATAVFVMFVRALLGV